MATLNDTVLVAVNATTIAFVSGPNVVSTNALALLGTLVYSLFYSVFLAGISVLEIVFLGILLLAGHYYFDPSHFNFIHKPNQIVPSVKQRLSDPQGIFGDCKLIMFAIDVADIGLSLTEFCLMLPILSAFLAFHLLGGMVLWCALPAAFRPVKLVIQLSELALVSARTSWPTSVPDTKALMQHYFLMVPRGARRLRHWMRCEVRKILQAKLKQALTYVPTSILDFLVTTDWEEQFERVMVVLANVAHYIFFEALPVALCTDFFYATFTIDCI